MENLNLTYKSLHAVSNVSFSVKSGEILAIIGQNGSGKTSTVECIEGLRKPDSGLIQVFGKDPWLHRSEIYKEMGAQLQTTVVYARFFSFFFALVFPVLMLLLFGSIYGNTPIYDGADVGTMDISVPAYAVMIMGVTGLMSFPLTLSGYKEKNL